MNELRVRLVLYGGVSLAIYMNGISTELWNLLRIGKARVDCTMGVLDDTTHLYAELLEELRCLTGDDLRVVVYVIAGTSAGGVAFIAAAAPIQVDQNVGPQTLKPKIGKPALKVQPTQQANALLGN